MNKVFLIGGAAAVLAIGIYWNVTGDVVVDDGPIVLADPGSALVDVRLPTRLSENAQMGKLAFEANCAACHNVDGAGRADMGPPLIHKIYEPSHHDDESFQRAAANGVRSHHWSFGDMPPVGGLTRADVQMIVAYIREIQRENGIN